MFAYIRSHVRDDPGIPHYFLITFALYISTFARPVIRYIGRPYAMRPERSRELGIKINGIISFTVAIPPTAAFGRTFHLSADRMIVNHFNSLPSGSSPHPSRQVYLDTRFFTFRECKTQHSTMRKCRCLRFYLIIRQHHSVITGRSFFRRLVVPGPISLIRIVRCSRKCMQFPYRGHNQQVSQIAIPANPAHLCKSKTFDRSMFVTITGTIIPSGNRIGTDLYHTERCRCPGKSLPQTLIRTSCIHTGGCPDKRVYIRRKGLLLLRPVFH